MFNWFKNSKRPIKDIIEGYKYKEEEKTLVSVLAQLKQAGVAAEFIITDEGLKDMATEKVYQPDDLVILDFYRFEGVSNPDDMAILYVLECEDGVVGTVTNAYGT